jgi:two-component system, cell cycle sensor histidine kinase and response regulator CckA
MGSKVNVSKQVRLLIGLSLIGFLVMLGMSLRLVEKVKVTGEAFQEMTEGKDLLADVLPPPGYLLELHHIALSIAMQGDGPKTMERLDQATTIIQTFEDRHQHWQQKPLTQELHLLENLSYTSGKAFIASFQKHFMGLSAPPSENWKRDVYIQILDPLFQTHQNAVQQLVKALQGFHQQVAHKHRDQENNGKFALTAFFVCFSLFLLAWGILVAHRVGEQREVEKKRLDEEAQNRFALAAANMAALEWDISSGQLTWSQEAEKWVGLANQAMPKRFAEWMQWLPAKERPEMEKEIRKALCAESDSIEFEYHLALADKSKRWFQAKGRVTRDAEGNAMLFRGIVMDITPKRMLETERAELENKLLHSQRMEAIGRLAGGVAHDFNNILTGIMGYCDLTLAKLTNHPAEKGLYEILDAAERASKLTKQLLAFSRKQVIQPEILDVVAVVNNLKSMLERIIGSNHQLIVETSETLPPVKADRGQIEQVVLNLVVNARDAMPEGGKIIISTKRAQRAEVRATWGNLESDENVLMLAVSDSGTGISPEMRENLFQPYFTTKAEGKGTGLGLSTVYGIVQQSGGAIDLESEVGHGTTFKIFLMGMTGHALPMEKQTARAWKAPLRCTVLVTEDDTQISQVIREGLENKGFKILLATNADSALLLLQKQPQDIDMLLTDVIFGGKNGVDLAERAMKLKPNLRVLFMTGYVSDLPIQKAMEGLHADLLVKPFTIDSLFDKVCETLQKIPATNLRPL